jgi:hypothetical protein
MAVTHRLPPLYNRQPKDLLQPVETKARSLWYEQKASLPMSTLLKSMISDGMRPLKSFQ